MTAREGYVDAGNGVQLFYRTAGIGAETVVVLHGGPGFTLEYLAEDLMQLAQRHTLLFYDQRGMGRSSLVSDAVSLDAQRFVDDLEALRRHFCLKRLTLLGHSWGAGLAGLYAIRHPGRVERLILVNGIPLRRSELVRTFQGIAANRDSAERGHLEKARDAWLADPGSASACRAFYAVWFIPFYGNKAASGSSKGDICFGSPAALRNKIEGVDRHTAQSLGDYDWRPQLATVTARSLVIHGALDVIAVESAREWAGALPNGRLLLMENIGHFPYLEAPDRFFAAVDEFMQGRWPDGAQPVARP